MHVLHWEETLLQVKQLRVSLGWPPAASRMLISPKRVTAGLLLNSTSKSVFAGTLAAAAFGRSSASSACPDSAGSLVNNVAPIQVMP